MKLSRTEPDIETIVSRINRGELLLQPTFQRGEIWDDKRKQRLVDTILRQWYIPPVHVVSTDTRQEVLDGQQRLVAIRDFMANKIVIDGSIEPPNEEIAALHGSRFSDLEPHLQYRVRNFIVPIMVLTDYNPDEPNELFFRLNQAYNLTPPEKRNALHGPARDDVRDMVARLTDMGVLSRATIGFSNDRLAYDDIVARSCVSLELDTLKKHINNNVVEEFYRRDHGFSSRTLIRMEQAGGVLLDQVVASTARLKFNKGTLQTWLLYCARVDNIFIKLPPELLSQFERDRAAAKRGDKLDSSGVITTILALYDDRASYRVTDVSSVLIRDLAISLYSQTRFDMPSRLDHDNLLNALQKDPGGAQSVALRYIEQTGWGEPLLPQRAAH